MSPTETKEWVKDNVATVPSVMLRNAIYEESMSDGDWTEVPDLEDWTVCTRKHKGSHCSDSPRHVSDDSSQSKGGEGVTPP